MGDKKSQDTTAIAAGARNGPGPTPEKFAAAVQKLLERGDKLTVRSIASIAGGTLSVVTQMLREYRAQQASQVTDQALPDAFILAAKELVVAARAEAESIWRQRYLDALDAQAEVELLLQDSERREIELRVALDAQTVTAGTRAALLEHERELHQAALAEVERALAAESKATSEASRLSGELNAAQMIAKAHEVDLRMQIEKSSRSEQRIEAIARENERLRAQLAHVKRERDAERGRNDNDRTRPKASFDADVFENDDQNDADRNPLSDGVPPSLLGQKPRPITGPVPTPTGSGCLAEGRLGAGTASDVTEGATSVAPDGAAVAGPATGPVGVSRT